MFRPDIRETAYFPPSTLKEMILVITQQDGGETRQVAPGRNRCQVAGTCRGQDVGDTGKQLEHVGVTGYLGLMKSVVQLSSARTFPISVSAFVDELPKGSHETAVQRFDAQDNVQILGGAKTEARLLRKTPDNMATPCSVKAYGRFRLPQRPFEVPIWNLKRGTSFLTSKNQ